MALPVLSLPRGLSARLFALTVAFVMAGAVLVFLPALARYRIAYLSDRIDAAHLAVVALEATPDNMVAPDLARRLLAEVGALGIVVHEPTMTLMIDADTPPEIDVTYDLRHSASLMPIADAVADLAQSGSRVMRVLGVAPKAPGKVVELLLDARQLRAAMWGFALRVFGFAMLISAATGTLLYFGLRRLLVTPLLRLVASMMSFRDDPEDGARVIRPEPRGDELGLAQRELAAMQETVRQALRQKERLAALGTAVAKINHDLRNILATARLVSDGLAGSAAPEVRRANPRLVAALDRAVALCTRTLTYTGEGSPPPVRRRFALALLGDELAGLVELRVLFENAVPPTLAIEADRDQLFRALHNLALNAVEAGAHRVILRAREEGASTVIEMADDGPGLPPKARDNLFRPFAGSARPGGTGLGLAIAREVMRAHGGDVALGESTGAGTMFLLTLPAPGEIPAPPLADLSASEPPGTPRAPRARG
ncbi:MAG TPA: HAMP domain-containing sensor histidine kinase [Stellaceae bacterium]|nr:HAMP domain-containing sensor histidine kinase [Stellaceae bacterium]